MTSSSMTLIRKIFIDIFCLLNVGFWCFYYHLSQKPFQRGFFCNDESIRYPDRESTVSTVTLAVIGNVMPICTMLFGEYLYARHSQEQTSRKIFNWFVPLWVSMAYKKIGIFLFGALSIILTTNIAKYSIGRLRPNFINLCKPNIDCSLPKNRDRYIEDFICTNRLVSPEALNDSRLSFPSGHSAISFYVAVYLVLYLHLRIKWKGSELLKYFCEIICLCSAWFTALSRISDYKHHWSDVLAGTILGIIGALIAVFYVADFFKEEKIIRAIGASDEEMMITTTNNIKIRHNFTSDVVGVKKSKEDEILIQQVKEKLSNSNLNF